MWHSFTMSKGISILGRGSLKFTHVNSQKPEPMFQLFVVAMRIVAPSAPPHQLASAFLFLKTLLQGIESNYNFSFLNQYYTPSPPKGEPETNPTYCCFSASHFYYLKF
jgi:hypothetical protein